MDNLKDMEDKEMEDKDMDELDSNDTRPVWLLDVDGVLNSLSSSPNPKELRRGEAVQKYLKTNSGPTFRMRVHNDLVAFVNRMHSSGLVDIRWATTWTDQANTVFAPAFDLPQLPVWSRPPEETGRFDDHNWKTGGALRVVHAGRKLIWTDDEAIPDNFDELVEDVSKGHLLVRPDEAVGLTLADCKLIEDFIMNT